MTASKDTSARRQRLNAQQRDWVKQYHHATGFEVMYLDEYQNGSASWEEFMRHNLNWLELHYQECYEAADSWRPWCLKR